MASPQCENGFTRIANELLEAITRYCFNGAQLSILLYTIRRTYGYNKTEARISLAEYVDATGRNKITVSRSLSMLIELNVIIEVAEPTNKECRIISVNKDYEGWRISLDGRVSPNETQARVSPNETLELAEMKPSSIIPKDNKKKGAGIPPSLDDTAIYGKELGLSRDQCAAFIDYHAAGGWKLKAGPMKDWRAALRTWKRRADEYAKKNGTSHGERKMRNWDTGEME